MSAPALHPGADIRSIAERINAILKNLYNQVIPVGAANGTLISDGATLAWQPDTRVLQVVSTQTGAVATGTTQLPRDDTIPQSTEGDQYMSLSITPKSAASELMIDVVFLGASSANSHSTVALFQDSTANALAAVPILATAADSCFEVAFRHKMTSGVASSTTFKVRAGLNSAGTMTFNGVSGGRLMGGVSGSSITITEVLP